MHIHKIIVGAENMVKGLDRISKSRFIYDSPPVFGIGFSVFTDIATIF
jgi:hypothetical protein